MDELCAKDGHVFSGPDACSRCGTPQVVWPPKPPLEELPRLSRKDPGSVEQQARAPSCYYRR